MTKTTKNALETQLVCANDSNDRYGASVPPLYQSTTYKQSSLRADEQEYDYTRSGNPTRTAVQAQLAKLYGVSEDHVLAVSSGMAALDVILRVILSKKKYVPTILTGDDLYGGTQRLLGFLAKQNYAKVLHVDSSDTQAVITAYNSLEKVDCVLLESPTNPLMKVADLPALIGFVKGREDGCVVVIDNTMVCGLNCNPLLLGADYVYESGTKYLNGHHDIMAGVIVGATPQLLAEAYFVVNSTGAGLAPMDSWLLIRGLKTLSLRLYQQQYNAMVIAHWLENQCGFKPTETNPHLRTRYVGLQSHPQFELHKSFNEGPGAVLSFETGDIGISEKIVCSPRLQIWRVTVSFGCVNSLISMPCKMSHAAIDPLLRKERNFPEDLIRLCCGIENVADLQRDLLLAFIDAGVLELVDNGNKILNTLNGHVARNSAAQVKQRSVYDDYFSQLGMNGNS